MAYIVIPTTDTTVEIPITIAEEVEAAIIIQGGIGPQGLKGDKGDKGDTGETGPQGIQGPKGDKGDKGDTGSQGPKGDKGDKGDQGPQGIQGPKGDKGETGEQGPQGVQGIQGLKGDKGDTGETGVQGPKGDKGDAGETGAPGQGIPSGGTTGQVLKKASGTDYDTEWTNESGAVTDVQVNGVSVLQDGVANVPVAGSDYGVVKENTAYGIDITGSGQLMLIAPSDNDIKNGYAGTRRAIMPLNQHNAVFYGLAKAAGSDEKNSTLPVGQYTESAKSAISEMLNGSVSVEGTTPTINALPGVRYVCGEVATLDIVTPASGIVDVVFTSGSTPTVLTVTPPSGMTMRWANGFDPTSLEADTVYEINIMDGCLGVAGTWT